jgi:hypothetical protein
MKNVVEGEFSRRNIAEAFERSIRKIAHRELLPDSPFILVRSLAEDLIVPLRGASQAEFDRVVEDGREFAATLERLENAFGVNLEKHQEHETPHDQLEKLRRFVAFLREGD